MVILWKVSTRESGEREDLLLRARLASSITDRLITNLRAGNPLGANNDDSTQLIVLLSHDDDGKKNERAWVWSVQSNSD